MQWHLDSNPMQSQGWAESAVSKVRPGALVGVPHDRGTRLAKVNPPAAQPLLQPGQQKHPAVLQVQSASCHRFRPHVAPEELEPPAADLVLPVQVGCFCQSRWRNFRSTGTKPEGVTPCHTCLICEDFPGTQKLQIVKSRDSAGL